MIIFYYKEEPSRLGQTVKRPVADVSLQSHNKQWFEFHPYIDSGADITLLPLSLGRLLGLKIEDGKVEQIGGIHGAVPVIYHQNRMRVGDEEFPVHLAWSLIEEVPPLLGRRDIFDRFKITFHQKEGTITFA